MALRTIGLTGYAGVGKDEVAKILVRHGYTRVAFADPMREILYALNPVVASDGGRAVRVQDVVDSAGWDTAKREYAEIRQLLQRLGTEAGRKVLGENIWIDLGFAKGALEPRVVYTDCRFNNECEIIRHAGGEIWEIARPGVGPLGSGHASDTSLKGDRTILNDGSLLDLNYAVFGALSS